MDQNLLKHFNHPFYAKVDEITDEVKLMQIRKGAEKYPEPFTPSSWTGKELATHALQELRDGQVYVVGLLERIEELEDEIKSHAPEGRNYTNKQYIELLQQNQRYKHALEEIVHGDTMLFKPYNERLWHALNIARQALGDK